MDPLPFTPRGLSREFAALYVGVSVEGFDALVSDRRMPQPKTIEGATVWDRFAIDEAFAALPAGNSASAGKASKKQAQPAVQEVFTPKSLAEFWGCSERHVRDMIARGSLQSFNVGKLVRIRRDEVEAYETRQKKMA